MILIARVPSRSAWHRRRAGKGRQRRDLGSDVLRTWWRPPLACTGFLGDVQAP